jgi:hypothetical protein
MRRNEFCKNRWNWKMSGLFFIVSLLHSLSVAVSCCLLLVVVGSCWQLLAVVGSCWQLLAVAGSCWSKTASCGSIGRSGVARPALKEKRRINLVV